METLAQRIASARKDALDGDLTRRSFAYRLRSYVPAPSHPSRDVQGGRPASSQGDPRPPSQPLARS